MASAKPKKPKSGSRVSALGVKSAAWEDPDSDDSDELERAEKREAKLEAEHANWGEKADTDSDADLKGSDSEDGVAKDDFAGELSGLLDRRKVMSSAPKTDDNGLWDPLAGLAPRKKRKVDVNVASAVVGDRSRFNLQDNSQAAGFPERSQASGFPLGTTVLLHGLTKAPHLNDQTGTVEGSLDSATGRCSVLLTDNSVKSLRPQNLKEVLTGAIVRLKDLKATALNGRIGECGKFDFSSGRYDVLLADQNGATSIKRIKEANLQVTRRFVTPQQMLSAQRSPFVWKDAAKQLREHGRHSWASQLEFLKKLRLPAPRLIPGAALKKFGSDLETMNASDARRVLTDASILAERAPVNADGRLACRLLAVSVERDVCHPENGIRDDDLCKLGEACEKLEDGSESFHFILPSLSVKPLPCLRDSAACGWPLYMQLCHALLCIESEYSLAKLWCRLDRVLACIGLQQPVYVLPRDGMSVISRKTEWLLSDQTEALVVDKLAFGQVLPKEKELAKKVACELLSEYWEKPADVTCYRL